MSGTTCRSGGEPALGPRAQLLANAQRKLLLRRSAAAVAMYSNGNSAPAARHIPTNASDCQLVDDFHACLMAGSVPQIARLHHFSPFLPAFAGSHTWISSAMRSGWADVLGGAFPALLMDQVKIA